MYPQEEVDVIVDMPWYNIFVIFDGRQRWSPFFCTHHLR